MCTFRGLAIEEVQLPKEGVKAFRLMRLSDDGYMPRMQQQSKGRPFACLFTHGRTKRVFTYYRPNVKYTAKNQECAFDGNMKTVATMGDRSGFHAFNSYAVALQEKRISWKYYKNVVITRVRLFGRAVRYEDGWRAEKMVVETVVCGRRPKVEGR